MVRPTDFDGDSIVIDAGAKLVVENDVPDQNAATLSVNVYEDGLTGLSVGIGGGATKATFTAAQLAGLVQSGADEPVKISFNDAIDCLAKRGICGLVTVPLLGKPFEFSPLSILKGRSVVGVLEGSSDPDTFIPHLMALHREGRLPYDRFCQRYAFSEVPRALADAATGRAIKPIIC